MHAHTYTNNTHAGNHTQTCARRGLKPGLRTLSPVLVSILHRVAACKGGRGQRAACHALPKQHMPQDRSQGAFVVGAYVHAHNRVHIAVCTCDGTHMHAQQYSHTVT